MWKNFVNVDRPQITYGIVTLYARIQGYKHTLITCNTYCFPQQKWLHEHASMLRYTYIAHLVEV
jgi:hypothetical protein